MQATMKKALIGAVLVATCLLYGCTSPDGVTGPVAAIIATPTQGNVPLAVHFDGSGSTDPAGQITDWLWDFGDGSGVASGKEVDHTYNRAGEHIITLVVVGPSGTGRATTIVRALNNPPLAAFTFYPRDPFQNESVAFDGASSFDPDGKIVEWRWDFGDGTTGEGEYVSHAFSTPGDYVVTLTVVDDSGAEARQSQTVKVEECEGGHCGRGR